MDDVLDKRSTSSPRPDEARRLFVTFALGFASGLPLALSSATLTYFLARYGVRVELVGLFGLVSIPYTYKFLWAPLFDRYQPRPFEALGRRRGWLLLTQLGLAVSIFATGATSPSIAPLMTACGALAIAFFSASQDVVVDAVRVETLRASHQGWGAALTQWGYRIGMMVSGFGALHLAEYFEFRVVYFAMALLSLLGLVGTWFAIEPEETEPKKEPAQGFSVSLIVAPFRALGARHSLFLLVSFLVVYRLGDAWAGQMTNPYLVQSGFRASEIANVMKLYGTIATVIGVALGGFLVSRVPAPRALPYAVILMAVSNIGYAWLATQGHSLVALIVAVSIENITSGLGGSVAIAWMSSLCDRGSAAAQYALLSALTSMSRTHLVALSGYAKAAVDKLFPNDANEAWSMYFLATVFAGVPGIVLAFVLRARTQSAEQRAQQVLEA